MGFFSAVGVFYYCCNANGAVTVPTNDLLEIKASGTELSADEFTQMGSGDSDDPAGAVCACMWHFPPAEFT